MGRFHSTSQTGRHTRARRQALQHSDWQRNAAFDAIKQSYLLGATSLLKSAADVEGLDRSQQRKLQFYLRQFVDAISPTNSLFTNPQVIHETIESGGKNLVNGTEHLLRDLAAGEITMTDKEAFTPGRNLAMTPGQVVHRNKLIELIQYTPTTDKVQSVPLLFIPPWINKYYILDMQPQNSLIKFLVDQGFTVFVISWKNPDVSMEDTTFDDYLEMGPLTSLGVVKEITGSPTVNPVGYCIGGTLLSMTLPYLAAKGDTSVNAATFLVALQDFTEVGDTAVFIDEPQVAYMEKQMLERGYLESRSMATMFNMLRANDLIWSNVVNNYLLGKEPPAFDLLYWNADGTRMARAAHSFYIRHTYLENNLIKPNHVSLKGVPIDLAQIRQDIYAVGTEQDHIVPWRSAWRITQLGKRQVALRGRRQRSHRRSDQSAHSRPGLLEQSEVSRQRRRLDGRRDPPRWQLVVRLARVAASALGQTGCATLRGQQNAPAPGGGARHVRAGALVPPATIASGSCHASTS